MSAYLPKLLITGGKGQLASALCHHPLAREYDVIACGRETLDIASLASVERAVLQFMPEVVINTAAYVAVDKAEQEKELAMHANQLGAEHLASVCQKYQIPLIHISTDYLFDGVKTSPYHENDAPNPINVYGQSKYLGEQAVRQHEAHIILRVSGIFSQYGNNFLKTMLRLADERKELRIVADQITCPTYASDIAAAIFALMMQPSHWGTYHYCSTQPVSWHQFATAIFTEAKKYKKLQVEEVNAVTMAEYPTPAKRPKYSVFDCTKIKNNFGIVQPSWELGIKKTLANLYST